MENESLLLEGGKQMDMLADVSMALGDSPMPSLGKKLGIRKYDSDVEAGGEESVVQDWDESGDVDEEQDDDAKTIMLPKPHPKHESLLRSPKSSLSPPPRLSPMPSPLSSPEEPTTPSPSSPKTPNAASKTTPGTNSKTRSKIKVSAQTEIIIVSSSLFQQHAMADVAFTGQGMVNCRRAYHARPSFRRRGQ